MKNMVRELRKEMGLTQEQLAAAINVSRQTINAIENMKYNPSLPLALRMGRLLGRDVEEIFVLEEEQ